MIIDFVWYIIVFGARHYVFAQTRTEDTLDLYKIRKNNVFEYNFDDWEESTQSVYYDADLVNHTTTESPTESNPTEIDPTTKLLPTYTDNTDPTEKFTSETKASSITSNGSTEGTTLPTEVTETLSPISEVTGNTSDVTESSDITDHTETSGVETVDDATIDNVTESATLTESIVDFTETLADTATTLNDTELDKLLYNYLTTTEKVEVSSSTSKVYENSTTSSPAPPPMVLEVKTLAKSLDTGLFTATSITFFRVIASISEASVNDLATAFGIELYGLRKLEQFRMFEPTIVHLMNDLVDMVTNAPPEFIKSQASFFSFALTTRKSTATPSLNAIFDIIDNIYTEEDATNVVQSIHDIDNYPDSGKDGRTIWKELLYNAIAKPLGKIADTDKERLLFLEFERLINKMSGGELSGARRKVYPIVSEERYYKGLRRSRRPYLKSPSQTDTEGRKARKFRPKDDYRNSLIKTMFRKKYEDNIEEITVRKNDARKIVKQINKLYKMRTNLQTEKKPPWLMKRYELDIPAIKSFRPDKSNEKEILSYEHIPDHNTSSDIQNQETMKSSKHFTRHKFGYKDVVKPRSKSTRTTERKFNKSFNGLMEIPNYKSLLNKRMNLGKKNKFTKENYQNSEIDADDEKYLRANLLDALVHGRDHALDVYKDKRRHVANVEEAVERFSNEEAVLKASVYKAFGYGDNFADIFKKQIL